MVNFIQFYDSGPFCFVSFIQSLISKHGEKIELRPELGLSKNRDPSSQVKLAKECIDSGAFRSIDLYGNEHAREPEAYASLYRYARGRGMKLKAHVGEFGDASQNEVTAPIVVP